MAAVTINPIPRKVVNPKIGIPRAWACVALAFAGWPVLRWYVARMTDGSDEPFGLVALVAALWFARRTDWRENISARRTAIACGFLAALAVAQGDGPPLLRAVLWVGAVAAIAAPALATAAWSGLLLLSLPVMASLQFFLSYPVRVGVTWAAAGVLRLFGLRVLPQATVLVWGDERVLIDAPCSGLQMAWMLSLITLILAVARKLTTRETLALLRFSAATVWGANVLRATALFLLEARFHVSATWMHDLAGLTLFAAAVLAVFSRSERIGGTVLAQSRVAREVLS